MNRINIKQLFAFAFLFMLLFWGCGDSKRTHNAVDGFLDLSSWDFKRDGIAYFDGDWEFYWGRLLTPQDLDDKNHPQKTGYFSIPGYWNGYRVNGKPLAGDGYATFRLKVKVKPGLDALALRIEEQSTAYQLWVNGSLIMANGLTGTNPDAMKPYKKISLADLPVASEYLDCVLVVSNFHMADGGPYRKIALGDSETVRRRHMGLFSLDLLLFGTLAIIACYHIILYLLRKKETSSIYFGFFCLSWCIGIPFGAAGGKFITLLFPSFPWYWVSRMELLTWFPSVPLFLMFFASLYPLEFSRKVTRSSQAIAFIFFIYVLFVPSRIISYTEVPYQLFSLGIIGYIFVMLISAMRYKRNGSGLMLTGFTVFVATAINDILFMNMIIYSVYLISFGIAIMIFFQSFALSRRFAQSFAAVEALTSELEEKNIALSHLDKLKDEFLANTSHELRTPLNGIIGIAESLMSGVTGRMPDKIRGNLSLIVSSGKKLAGLINDILDFSRLKNQDIRLYRKLVDIRALTDTVLSIMKPLATGKDIKFRNDISGNLLSVWGDEDRLQQIFYNLIGNAIKFTDHGEIRVSAKKRDAMIDVSIADTGIGIAEDKQENIFYPFKQADSSDARTHEGAGLGLSITRHLVELHGGRITVQSKPGEGSVFCFSIPAAQGEIMAPRQTEIAKAVIPPAGPVLYPGYEPVENLPGFEKRITILAIDDDPVNLQVVSNHLTFKNVTVITAPGGMQAVQLIEGGLLPDLVLLDIMMPRMTGYEVSRWLRRRYTASELPIIMLTAKNRTDDLVQGFAQGANDYLAKPFVRDELLARVVSQLKLKQSYLTLRENMTLRKELEERKQVERELRFLQQSLSLMLDTVDEALLAVNEDEEITFCNRGCEELLGYRTEDLLGKPFMEIIQRDTSMSASNAVIEAIRQCINGSGNSDLDRAVLMRFDGSMCEVHVYLSIFYVEEESICLLILRKNEGLHDDRAGAKNIEKSIGIIEAVNQNRLRLQSIKTSLNGLLPLINEKQPEFLNELKAIDEALDNVGRSLLNDEDYESRRHLAVEVMNCALTYWTESTGLTKAELAHQSRLWKVYTNMDGWERTQTLDKYLDIEIFPKKPLWLKIFKTAEFVLANDDKPSALRTRLEVLLARLRVSK